MPHKYYAVPVHQQDDKVPEEGTFVICLVNNKLWAGTMTKIDYGMGWAVKTPDGKTKCPYLSDIMTPGCKFKKIKPTIEITG